MINEMKFRRRELMKVGFAGAGVVAAGKALTSIPQLANGLNLSAAASVVPSVAADSVYIEAFPTSPLVLNPFTEAVNMPPVQRPVSPSVYQSWANPPGKIIGYGADKTTPIRQQDSNGGTHQYWPGDIAKAPDGGAIPTAQPLVYLLPVQVGQARVTNNKVLPINSSGQPVKLPSDILAKSKLVQNSDLTVQLPQSTIWGFNGGFPGAIINAEYGKPVLVRFKNDLSDGICDHPDWPQYDYGSGIDKNTTSSPPGFLIHLHNGHTAPESDGNPNYRGNQKVWRNDYKPHREAGYVGCNLLTDASGKLFTDPNDEGDWVDNLYLNYPAGGDPNQKQSFFWFHDHYHNHTGADVYKGMVGLFPIYDPDKDNGNETNPNGYGLPGVRTDRGDGSFDVKYDIPLALYDVRLDDGITPHKDYHSGNGETHPELWGHKFFKHFPNHGFVGDIFTVNGTAYPVLEVEPRQYRLRFLDSSISRIYKLQLMSSAAGPKPAKDLGYKDDELQGQYRLPDGKQCIKWVQVAAEGGLLTRSYVRDSFELWPAKRREFVVDFSHDMNGNTFKDGAEIFLVNISKMPDGRMPTSPDPNYKVPMMKFVVRYPKDAAGKTVMPVDNSKKVWSYTREGVAPAPVTLQLRPMSPVPSDILTSKYKRRTFTLERGSSNTSPEVEWLINGQPFDPTSTLASVPQMTNGEATWEVWEIKNGGGGWVHPMHLHMEEHRVLTRNGKPVDPNDPENYAREDVIALGPSESVVLARRFRTFKGKYVAHCHNLAHEDHNMMFGWEIV